MAATRIQWATDSWNPIRARNKATGGRGHFCVHVSDGCKNCYAERMQPRFYNPIRYAAQDRDKVEIYLDEKVLMQPLHWRKPRMIFVCSMTDLFGDWVTDEMLDHMFAVMALCPQHTFQILTKRPERMREYIGADRMGFIEARSKRMLRECSQSPMKPALVGITLAGTWTWPHIWLGVSVEDQPTADERIPILLDTPAAIRWVSAEPLLARVSFMDFLYKNLRATGDFRTHKGKRQIKLAHDGLSGAIDWVITGGESGPKARPSHPEWFRSLRDQCARAGVPFFFKQWGNFLPMWEDRQEPFTMDFPAGIPDNFKSNRNRVDLGNGWVAQRVRKKLAGRMLDGREHSEYPALDKGLI